MGARLQDVVSGLGVYEDAVSTSVHVGVMEMFLDGEPTHRGRTDAQQFISWPKPCGVVATGRIPEASESRRAVVNFVTRDRRNVHAPSMRQSITPSRLRIRLRAAEISPVSLGILERSSAPTHPEASRR